MRKRIESRAKSAGKKFGVEITAVKIADMVAGVHVVRLLGQATSQKLTESMFL
jgi:hypothetical protein